MKRFLATALVATMLVSACPMGMTKAAELPIEEASRGLSKAVSGVKADATVDNGIYEVKFQWNTMKGAKYQYRYKLADSAAFEEIKSTSKTKASITFGGYSNITFQVRAVKTVNGVKQYSVWTTKKLKASAVDSMFEDACGLKPGYIKGGIIYQGGWKAADPKNPDCDLTIAIFTVGMVQTGDIMYIVYRDGKIDYYGILDGDSKTTADGKEYMELAVPEQGEDRPAYTVGYGFTADFSDSYLITAEGKTVKADELGLKDAWKLQEETDSIASEDEATEVLAKKVLANKAKSLAKKEEKGLPITYGLKDVDKDGIVEMFYVRGYNRMQIEVYRYDDKKDKAVLVKKTNGKKTLDGVGSIYSHQGEIVVEAASSAYEGEITAYRITEDGKLKSVTRYQYNYATKKFSKNGKKIKKATFEKYQAAVAKYTQIDVFKKAR